METFQDQTGWALEELTVTDLIGTTTAARITATLLLQPARLNFVRETALHLAGLLLRLRPIGLALRALLCEGNNRVQFQSMMTFTLALFFALGAAAQNAPNAQPRPLQGFSREGADRQRAL